MNFEFMERLAQLGFLPQIMIDRVKAGLCPTCSNPKILNGNDFQDDGSLDEFIVTGMCQKCQEDGHKKRDKLNNSLDIDDSL